MPHRNLTKPDISRRLRLAEARSGGADAGEEPIDLAAERLRPAAQRVGGLQDLRFGTRKLRRQAWEWRLSPWR